MKHFKDPSNNEIYAFEEDGSQDAFIRKDLVMITDAEADAIRNPLESAEVIVDNALQEFRFFRISVLRNLDGLQISAVVTKDDDKANVIETIKQALRDFPLITLPKNAITDEKINAEYKSKLQAIISNSGNLSSVFDTIPENWK